MAVHLAGEFNGWDPDEYDGGLGRRPMDNISIGTRAPMATSSSNTPNGNTMAPCCGVAIPMLRLAVCDDTTVHDLGMDPVL